MAALRSLSSSDRLHSNTDILVFGERRRGGYLKRAASTLTKALGRRTPATDTPGASSSPSAPGTVWRELPLIEAHWRSVPYQPRDPSQPSHPSPLRYRCTLRTSSGSVTVEAGANGEPPARADSDRPWPSWST